MIQALLFDIDGTLTETDPLHFRAWRDRLARLGVHIDHAAYQERVSGRLNPDIVAELLPDLGPDDARTFIDDKERLFRELATELSPLPGLHELLAWAQERDLPVAVVSNAPHDNALMVLEALGVHGHFVQVVLAEHVGRGKPHPDAYEQALRLLGVKAAHAVAFEDSPAGVQAAVAAGIRTVGLATGHDPSLLLSEGAVLVAGDFTDPRLLALVQNPDRPGA